MRKFIYSFIAVLNLCAVLQANEVKEIKSSIKSTLVKEITTVEQFEREIKNSAVPIFIDFYATWCGPCKRLSPFVETWAQNYKDRIKFLKVNVDEAPSLSQNYQIQAMPTLLILNKNGKVLDRKVGYDIYQLMNRLEKEKSVSINIETVLEEQNQR